MKGQITFYLVRHGEAEQNVQRILNSLPEKETYSLTDHGRAQIGEVASFLKGEHADLMISSPILRTRQTAEIISEATGLSFTTDERLRETDFGLYNGQSADVFLEKYRDPAMRISPDPSDGVESFVDMRGRLTSFLENMKKKHSGKKVIVVSHGDPLEQIHGILIKESPGISANGWYPKKGSCTEVVWEF